MTEDEKNQISMRSHQNSTQWIYPNPATDYIRIEEKMGIEKYDLLIYSSSGKLVFKKLNNSDSRIDLPNLKNGLYIFQIHSSKGNHNEKIIISK